MLLMALAIAPGLAICLYFFYKDVYDQEPARNLFFSFLLGMAAIVPAAFLEVELFKQTNESVLSIIFTSYLSIALVEEFFKFLVLRHFCYNLSSFDEPLDGIVYSVMVSMGFATLENIGYVWLHGYPVAFIRMFTSVPAHATFAVIMGYYVGKAKFNWPKRRRYMVYGLLGASVAHGTYDLFLLLGENHWLKQYVSEALLFAGAIISLFIAIRLSRRLLQLHHLTSVRLFNHTPVLTIKNASASDIDLIRSLSQHVWPHTYANLLPLPQIHYMQETMYSAHALRRQMDERQQFIIVYNAGVPVGFASYSELENSVYKLHKIYILPVHQGRGMGRFVVQQVINDILPKGATALQLNINRNHTAINFYEKLGFEAIRAEDTDIGNGYFLNDFVMEKKLDEPFVNVETEDVEVEE